MKLERMCKHLASNKLPEAEIEKLLRAAIEPAIGHQWFKGYMRSTRDQKRLREARQARRDKEFKGCLDFISDLTHDKT